MNKNENIQNSENNSLHLVSDTPKPRRRLRPPRILHEEPEKTTADYNQCLSLNKVAKLLDVNPQTVRRMLTSGKTSQFVEDQMMINLDATTKARKGRQVFVNPTAFEIIRQCRVLGDELWEQLKSNRKMADEYAKKYGIKTRGDIPFILFPKPFLEGKKILRPIQSITKAWLTARRKAGLDGKVRFHDTRASFCTYLAQLDVNVLDIQKLAGHENVQTTMRYIGAGNKNLRSAVDLLAKMRPLEVQSQNQKSDEIPKKSHTEVTDTIKVEEVQNEKCS